MSPKSVNLYGEEVTIGLLTPQQMSSIPFQRNYFLDFQFISSSQLMSARRISAVTSASVLVRWEGGGLPVGGGAARIDDNCPES